MNFERAHPSEDREKNERKIERLLSAGTYYASFLEHAAGLRAELEPAVLEGADEGDQKFFAELSAVAKELFGRFHQEQAGAKRAASDFIRIAAKIAGNPARVSENMLGQSKLEEPSPGVFVVYAPTEFFTEVMQSTAVCIRPKDDPSFIVLEDVEKPDSREAYLRENLPHELHHVIWKAALEAGVVKNAEPDKAFEHSFRMYQDELLAKISSGGVAMGYDLFSLIRRSHGQERLDIMLDEAGIDASQVNAARVQYQGINDVLESLRNLMEDRGLKQKLLIPVVATSTTYGELASRLKDVQRMIEEIPPKPSLQDPFDPWGGR